MKKSAQMIIGCVYLFFFFCSGVLAETYKVETVDPATLELPAVQLPDISQYTPTVVKKMLADARNGKPGKVEQKLVRGLAEMRALYSGEGLLNMGLMQKNLPSALVIEQGVMTLQQISRAYPKQLVAIGEKEYLAKLPIVVAINATLIMEDSVLKLSEEKGAIFVNGGRFFLQGGALLGWRESAGTPAYYTGDKKEFRPYYVAWGGSKTYFSETRVAYLGYFGAKTYGVTLASYEVKTIEKIFQREDFDFSESPEGWLINSTFSDIFYGFYCFEAKNIIILNNTYSDNIIYGIDPHDWSSGLIIAKNHVYGTKKKHGIIISREVNDSFIFDNESHDNKLSGIMLDRQSRGNQLVRNTVYNNGSDGITLYESGDNLISGNTIYTNGAHGIRLRNSKNVTMTGNFILNNKAFGIYLHTKDLLAQGQQRDLEKDPYRQEVSGILAEGAIVQNSSGSIFIEHASRFNLYNVLFDGNGGSKDQLKFGGDLARYHNEVVRSLWGKKGVASLIRKREP